MSNWKRAGLWLSERLSEKSSWGGIVTTAATLGGMAVAPDKSETIATVGSAAAGFLLFILKDAPKE